MAQRLATEYVKACLKLSEEELALFARTLGDQHVKMQTKVLDNGNHELALEDVAGREEIHLTFERQKELFVCVLSCRLVHPKLTNAMRKAVSMFRGDAIVNRIYPNYTMVYYYNKGAVHKIIEMSKGQSRVIYEFKDTAGQLARQFLSRGIEQKIEILQNTVNELLDLRNQTKNTAEIEVIDACLKEQTRMLFMLEA